MGGSARKHCASCSPAIHLPRAERRPYTPWTLACGIAATRKPALSAYYYHPSRHSAGQPIVAGWAYQFVAQLGFVRESWTAPVDVQRVLPAQDANEVATQQIEALLGRLEEGEAVPVHLRRRLRSRQGAASTGGEPKPDTRPLAGGRRFYGDPSL